MQETHINTTSLIYHRDTHTHIYIFIYIYIYTPSYTTSWIYMLAKHIQIDTATYILYHICIEEVHTHYNINRSYINIHSNTRL